MIIYPEIMVGRRLTHPKESSIHVHEKNLGIILASMMFLTACGSTDEAQGYGTHIFGQPTGMLAADGDPQDFGIPEGYVPLEFIQIF